MLDVRVNLESSYKDATAARPGQDVSARQSAQQVIASIKDAVANKKKGMPGLQVRLSGLTGAAELVRNNSGTLTGTSGGSSESIVRGFLSQNRGLYGLSAGDLSDLTVLGDSKGGRSGLRMLRMEQRIHGRSVFQSETRFILDRNGRLVSSSGRMIPQARTAAGTINDAALITPAQAVSRLLAVEGQSVSAASLSVTPAGGEWMRLEETDDYITDTISARPMLFPLGPGQLIPAWALVVFTAGENDWYAIVDAETGVLLWRKNIRNNVSLHDARFRVFVQADGTTPADNPAPGSPNTVTPSSGTQFPFLPPSIVSMHTAMDAIASPNGWIDDCPGGICTANETQTLGNNTLTCLDRAAPANVCDTDAGGILDGAGRPTGNPDANTRDRDFLGTAPRDFETNFLPPPQTTAADAEAGQTATGAGASGTNALDQFRRGAVTHLFYVTNWYHDKLFALGFDEPSANFQNANFQGLGGLGGDRVLGDAQDASGTNNANFSTPPDGVSGRMQMFRFTFPTIDRDGGLDAEIAIHELTHGTSNRLVGNGAGLNWDPAGGMGEGWSDFYALSLLNNTNADDPDGQYANGGYATYKLGGLLDNYLYGIRRFPYSTDNAINPSTWADVDDVTNDLSGGIAPDPLGFNFNGGAQVHNAGTIWALTLWEVRSRVIADPAGANGDVPTGNNTMLQLVTDGLKLTPIDPSYTDGRDALFDADCATNACANEESIWGGFADRGLGYKSSTPYNVLFGYTAGHIGVRESFSVPFLDVIDAGSDVAIDDSASNNNGALDPGEAVYLTVSLTNPWRAASKNVASATAVLTTSTPGVTIFDNAGTWGAIAAQGTTPSAVGDFLITLDTTVACGSSINFTLTTTSSLGVTATDFSMRVGNANGTDPLVTYTSDPNPNVAIADDTPLATGFDTLNITDDFEIADLDFRADSVTHTFTGDLTLMLRSPQGIGIDLIGIIGGLIDGGPGDNMVNMVADDDVANIAANDMVQASSAAAPYTKSWLPVFNGPWPALAGFPGPDPVGNLSRYDGSSTLGNWTIAGSDQFAADTGTINAWSMLVTPVHFDCVAFAPAVIAAATKTVAGTFEVGGVVTYTVTLTNTGTDAQNDNPGNELIDVLPGGLTLVSAIASSGTATANVNPNEVTWSGSLAPLGGSVTITITATVNAGTQGTVISNQGTFNFDGNNDNVNESSALTDDPGVGGASDPTSFLVASSLVTGTKTVSAGPYTVGGSITYTITLSNNGSAPSPDNAGDEFTDVLPATLNLVSANASSGTPLANLGTNTVTWNGSIPAAGSVTITIDATIDPSASGSSVSNQGTFCYDADLTGDNETCSQTDDPGTGAAGDSTAIIVAAAALDTLTKTVSAGPYTPGAPITYTIIITNTGDTDSPDNATDELTDVLPAALTLVSASATSGTSFANVGTNTVTWNGIVPANGSVTITINAILEPGNEGSTVSNQATLIYDPNGTGTNDTTVLSDDPGTVAANDPTSFVAAAAAAQIPTASELGLLLLAAGLAMMAAWKISHS
ncbi:MAG: M36 family metallopeptidase [Acidobacteriota bacterium]|nr:M36 family metallopeptidase [Acidobacteriota bacterium]